MNKKLLVIGIAILILLLFFAIKGNNYFSLGPAINNTALPGIEDSCNSAGEYKAQCEQMNAWLDKKLAEWKPKAYVPMLFGSRISTASYPEPSIMIDNYNDIVIKDLELQLEADPDIITIEWYYSLSTLEKNNNLLKAYDNLINEIRKHNKKIMIADTSGESNLAWSGWKQSYASQVRFLTERWKPDYYVIVFEPDNYMGRFSNTPIKPRFIDPENATTEEWVSLTDVLAKTVKSVNPNTRTAIALSSPGFYAPYLNYDPKIYFVEASKIKELDILGLDIFLGPNPDNAFEQMEDLILKTKDSGKKYWIIGTWGPIGQGGAVLGNAREMIDAKFLHVVDYFAQKNGFEGIGDVFGTHLFVSYDIPKNPLAMKEFFAKNTRTQPFYEYKSIIEEAKLT